jgi:hypothetical protein
MVDEFRRCLCRSGVSPDIERFTLAGGTPALHSRRQNVSGFLCKISRGLPWLPKIDRSPKLLASIADYFDILCIHECFFM